MPSGCELLAQRAGQAFERRFGRGVVAGARRGDPRADRGDVHDRAAAARAHAGQHRLDHRDGAEEVGGEQPLHVGVVAFLDGGAVAVAGVVDQHVDAAEALPRPPHRLRDLRVVGHVERDRERRVRVGVGEVLHARDVARGDDGVVAAASTASASARPRPVEQPVMSQVDTISPFGGSTAEARLRRLDPPSCGLGEPVVGSRDTP